MNRVPPTCAAVLAAALLATTGCGTDQQAEAERSIDPEYAYSQIASFREESPLHVLEPQRLLDALPNREVAVRTPVQTVRNRFSDLVVLGTVTDVRADEGIHYPNAYAGYTGDDADAFEVVDFEDPAADERSAIVTIEPEWSAGDPVSKQVQFRIGVPPDTDPDRFLDSVAGMGKVVTLLDTREGGRNAGDYYAIMGRAAIGSIGPDGQIAFPGLGEDASSWAGSIDTVDELTAAASEPTKTVQYE